MDKPFLQTLNLYRGKSALQISPSPELALVFVSLAPAIPGMENKMPDKNSKKYQWEKKLTASFNFEGALEVAAAAAALAQGREELVSDSDGTLPSWYRDPTKMRPRWQCQDHRLLSSKGPTENSKGSLFPWNHRKQQETNRETRSVFLWSILTSSKSPA